MKPFVEYLKSFIAWIPAFAGMTSVARITIIIG